MKTIKGTYVFEARGAVVDEGGDVVPYAEAGVWTLDGEGKAEGFISIGINGENLPDANKAAFTAEYALVTDCVYEVTDEFGLVVDLYATRSGSTITYYAPGFSGTMYRR